MCRCTCRDGRHDWLSALKCWLRSAYDRRGAANTRLFKRSGGKDPQMDTFTGAVAAFLLHISEGFGV